MESDASERALGRLIVGCLVVMVDLNIQTIDLVFDPVGYLIIAQSAGRLVRFEPTMSALRATSMTAAVFSASAAALSIPSALRLSRNTRSVELNVGFNQRGLSNGDSTALELARDLNHLALAVCGWLLVWLLVAGLARMANRTGADELATSLDRVRTPLSAALPLSALVFRLTASPGETAQVTGDDTLLQVLLLVAVLVLGVWGLWLVGRACRELRPVEAMSWPTEALRPPVWLIGLIVAAAVAGVVTLVG